MLLRRCAWHPLYAGRRKILGIASWRFPLLGVAWSDGCCATCARRVLDELRASRLEPGRGPDPASRRNLAGQHGSAAPAATR